MLDFGFSEILLTSAIALVVLGPERLPKVARQVGNWMGRARLMARQLGEQLEREVSADELLKEQNRSAASRNPPPQAMAPLYAPDQRPSLPTAPPTAPPATPPAAAMPAAVTAPVEPDAAPHTATPAVSAMPFESSASADGGTSHPPHE